MIARRTFLAAATLAAGAVTLLSAGCTGHPAAAGQPPAPSTTIAPSTAAPSTAPSAAAPDASTPPASAPPGLPGRLYYVDGQKLLRLTASGLVPVLSTGGFTATISPDGASIAFVDDNANVVVADRDGKHRRTVLKGSVGAGWEPAWSPDSRRLLTVKNAGNGRVNLGIITIATATFTPLPHTLHDAIHPLWSADGKHLGYATGTCQLGVSDADGGNARVVPVFGDLHSKANPQKRRSCDPYSISRDGRYIAVNQRTGDDPDGDIARNLNANTIIDTRTGANVSLPVKGSITAILFQPNGDILVRTSNHQLTLLNPDHTVKAHVTEPAAAANAQLLAYTQK